MVSVGVEWINNFPEPCDQPELSYCDDTAVGFYNGMVSRGHSGSFNWGNSNAWERDFRDSIFGGDDHNWIDNVDFAHFSSHGSCSVNNVYRGYFGGQVDNCTWQSDSARLGNQNLEWLALDTCNSLELTRNIISVWHNAFHRLHMILGFTDLVSDSSWTASRGYNFGRRAGNNDKLADAWLDECYSFWADDNPVAMTSGRTRDDAIYRRDNERIYSNFSDIPHNEISWYAWKWRS
jgi:Family of unknown function (DUF6345)